MRWKRSESRAKCIELFVPCSDMSDNKEDFGIKKEDVEDGEEEKEREVHKEDEYDTEEVREEREVHGEYKYDM